VSLCATPSAFKGSAVAPLKHSCGASCAGPSAFRCSPSAHAVLAVLALLPTGAAPAAMRCLLCWSVCLQVQPQRPCGACCAGPSGYGGSPSAHAVLAVLALLATAAAPAPMRCLLCWTFGLRRQPQRPCRVLAVLALLPAGALGQRPCGACCAGPSACGCSPSAHWAHGMRCLLCWPFCLRVQPQHKFAHSSVVLTASATSVLLLSTRLGTPGHLHRNE
jgi:hypothetical protein